MDELTNNPSREFYERALATTPEPCPNCGGCGREGEGLLEDDCCGRGEVYSDEF